MSIIQGTSKAAGGGYEIEQSIRFNDDDSAYLTRTPGSASNRKTWTISTWFKYSVDTASGSAIFGSGATAAEDTFAYITSGGAIDWIVRDSSTIRGRIITNRLFRDPSAWYHLIFVLDTTSGTAGNRMRLYVNGSEETSFSTDTNPPVNTDSAINSTLAQYIGFSRGNGGTNLWEGYQAEINLIDGTALDPTSFGETNDDGVWIPKRYGGSYGTNGFYLTGETASDLGEDFSGNNNDFSSSGLSSADSVSDSPSLNHCTLNPLITPATMTLTDGNLALAGYASSTSAYGTFGLSSGKWFWQIVAQANAMAGIAATPNGSQYPGQAADSYSMDLTNGTKYNGGSSASYGSGEISAGDVIGVGFDADAGTLKFFDSDGNDIGTAYSSLTSGPYFPVFRNGNSANISINFGQTGAFTFTPSGYNALNTANIATPSVTDPSLYFQPTLYTGTGSSQAVSQAGNSTFQPDWVWIKGRSGATEHVLTDAVRGVTKEISSNDNGAEETVAQGLTTFGSAGFTVGTDGSYNTSSATYVGWQWAANGSGSSNEDGATTSTASANTTSGFSIVKWTGTGANTTLGHGLGAAPKMILVKNTGAADSWVVYHEDVGATKGLTLDTTAASTTASTFFNNTAPTSSVFSIGSGGRTNQSTKVMIAYCFAEIPGYSSIGSYTGNGNASGPFIYTNGMKPAFILIKSVGVEEWSMTDSTRDPTNRTTTRNLVAHRDVVEEDPATRAIDYLSNGFKIRHTNSAHNSNGVVYTYMAFSENPFGGADIAPATAR